MVCISSHYTHKTESIEGLAIARGLGVLDRRLQNTQRLKLASIHIPARRASWKHSEIFRICDP